MNRRSYPSVLQVMGQPAHHSLQHMLLVAHVELLHRQQLTQAIWGQLAKLLAGRHVAEVGLQVLCGHMVHMVQAVVQRKQADAHAILRRNAALQELAAQRLEVGQQQEVGRLHHVLDGLLAQRDLRGETDTTREKDTRDIDF